MDKQTKTTIVTIFFLIVSAFEIYAVQTQNQSLEMIFKPLLMVVLAVLYLISVKKPSFWFLSALFFSFWGDVFLLFKDKFFVFGLGSFLLAHVLYIKITSGMLPKVNFGKLLKVAIPFVLFFIALVYLIFPNLREMLVPVMVYGLVISTFGAVTLLNYTENKTIENGWLFLGAIIFIASDSMIAINKFYQSKPIFSVLIMVTYIVAQYLITKAMITKDVTK